MIKKLFGKILIKGFLFIFFIIFSVNAAVLHAQNTAPYLVPRQIYVGDPATLVLPLPAAAQNSADIILTKNDNIPKDPNIDFNRIILERRTIGSRLLIEFTPFAPGTLEFPVIEIGGEFYSGLTVNVNSLLDANSKRLLSGAASALAMPGTALMLYGSMILLVIIILLAVWFIFKGQAVIQKLRIKWKRFRLFAGMSKTEKKLQKALLKGVDKRLILDKLSDEFRVFLSILTGNNCRSMTSSEFECPFLSDFFNKCDGLRFSGAGIDSKDIVKLLFDLHSFLDSKSKEEKAK